MGTSRRLQILVAYHPATSQRPEHRPRRWWEEGSREKSVVKLMKFRDVYVYGEFILIYKWLSPKVSYSILDCCFEKIWGKTLNSPKRFLFLL